MSKKRKKTKASSYDHMMGSPMDVANHPTNNLPDPAGGMFNPTVMASGGQLPPE